MDVLIGDWRMSAATNELSRAGATVRLEPKAMEVLALLAARAGNVISRKELLAAVWPGVIVGDEALTQSVIKLRRALGDNPRLPAYIETISKRGYRLIAPVRACEEGPRAPVRARRRLATGWLVAAALVALVPAGAYIWRAFTPPAPTEGAADAWDDPHSGVFTVSVLPFEALGAGAGQADLARGISSDLMTDLSRVQGLRLIAATAGAPAPKGASYLVSGSVERAANILRINVRLTDNRTGRQLWSERYEGPYGDLFALQDEISRRLSAMLPVKLDEAARRQIAKRYTRSLEAYDDFVRAQALFLIRHAEANAEARVDYRKAIERDPNFARAYAGLAMTYAMQDRLQPGANSSVPLRKAFELATTARQIDPDIPEVYWALAFVDVQRRRHEEALDLLRKAIELNRSYADAYALMAGIYTYVGRPSESIPLLRTAMRLNPSGGYLYYLNLGRAYLFENDIEQALINLREATARNRPDLETRILLAAALEAAGDSADAQWEAEEIRTFEAGFSLRRWLDAYPLTDPGERKKLEQLLAGAGLQEAR
jgi:DNA-binding winged helix-turn-helix (wHTH) protein/TolB-like protein/Tfp pilus assembly protein PilF